ncbi:MAG: NAD(P)/FAD-dependent oxidoreductase [Bacteroidaceae bacterium]|nr:NAD(P)/FAD-dependent oxidoreductase [Bacteroidaceae bacterium]
MSKVIIIGSGLGGLTCGFILQKNGYDVTVLEQGHQIGGCLQCFSRQGVKFETGMHFIGSAAEGQTMNRLMNFLCLTDVELSPLDPKGYDTIALAGETFRFPNGRDAFVEQMSSYFPKEKDNLKHYIDLVARIASASTLNSLTSEERDLAMNTEYQTRSINDVLESLFRDEILRNVLVGNLPLYAAERDKTPFAQHAFIMDFYNQSAFRVVGGSDVIAHSLARSIKEMGGQVLTDKRACRIRCNETQATGVETADECFFPADYVVSTVHPARFLELLDTKLIRPAFRSRLSNIPNTTGCFTLYVKFKENTMPYMNTNFYGYHSSSPWDSDQHDYLYMHHCHRDKARFAKSGVVLSYMKMDEVARWQGTCVGHRGADYEAFKHEHAEQLIQDVERHHPGFTAAIDTYYTSTPLTYLDYTGTENGSMYGVAKDIHLGPAGRVPYRTKVPNLFLAGQNVNSHGMMGVLVGTIVTCSELLKQSNREITNLFNG